MFRSFLLGNIWFKWIIQNANNMKRLFLTVLIVTFVYGGAYANNPIMTLEGTFTDTNQGLLNGFKRVVISLNQDSNLTAGVLGRQLWRETLVNIRFVNGYMSIEIGRINPLKTEYFNSKNLAFIVEIEDISGRVSIPVRHVSKAIFSEYARTAETIPASGIIGTIPSQNFVGNLTGIEGVGELKYPLKVKSDLIVNDTQLVVNKSNGWVGIGTATPQAKMDIAGDVKVRGKIVFPDGSSLNSTTQLKSKSDSIVSEKHVVIQADTNKNSEGDFLVSLGGVKRMVMKNNGQMGVGVEEPRQQLDINGAIVLGDTNTNVTGSVRFHDKTFQGYNGKYWQRLDIEPSSAGGWTAQQGNSEVILTYDIAKVGIGVKRPTTKLDVDGTVKATIFSGKGSELTDVPSSSIKGVLSVSQGGLGSSTFSTNSLIRYDTSANRFVSLGAMNSGFIAMGSSKGIPTLFELKSGAGIAFETTANQFTISHADTSTLKSITNNAGLVVQQLAFDDFGHVTGVKSANLDDRFFTQTLSDQRFLMLKGGSMKGGINFSGVTRDITSSNDEDIAILPGKGNVGIGVESPKAKLDIMGAIRIGYTSSNVEGIVRYNSTNRRFEGRSPLGWVPLDVAAAESVGWKESRGNVLYADISKKLGIGTFAPEYPVHVDAQSYFHKGVIFNDLVSFNTGFKIGTIKIDEKGVHGDISLNNSRLNNAFALNSKRIGIGLSKQPLFPLEVSGNAYFSGMLRFDASAQNAIKGNTFSGNWQFNNGELSNIKKATIGTVQIFDKGISGPNTLELKGNQSVTIQDGLSISNAGMTVVTNNTFTITGKDNNGINIEGVLFQKKRLTGLDLLGVTGDISINTNDFSVRRNISGVGMGRQPVSGSRLAIAGDVMLGNVEKGTDGQAGKSNLFMDGNLIVKGNIFHKGGSNVMHAMEVETETRLAKNSGKVAIGAATTNAKVGITAETDIALLVQDNQQQPILQLGKNGRMGVGVTQAVGFIHVQAGTETVPAMVLNKGKLLTTLLPGALEYDGENIYITSETSTRNELVNTIRPQTLSEKTLINNKIRSNTIQGTLLTDGDLTIGTSNYSIALFSKGYSLAADGTARLGDAHLKSLNVSGDTKIMGDFSIGTEFLSLDLSEKTLAVGLTQPSNNVRLHVSGNVVIGTMPVGKSAAQTGTDLFVNGSTYFQGALTQKDGIMDVSSLTVEGSASLGTNGSKVGIGTNQPSATLEIRASENSSINNVLKLGNGSRELMIFTKTGRLGIASSDPKEALEVSGTIKALQYLGDGSRLTGLGTVWNETSDGKLRYMKNTIGVHVQDPIAYLHVAAHSAATPSLILNPSTVLLSNPATGAFEYVKSPTKEALFFTTSGNTRQEVIISNFTQTLKNKTLLSVILGDSENDTVVSGLLKGVNWRIQPDGKGLFETLSVKDISVSGNTIGISSGDLAITAGDKIRMHSGLAFGKSTENYSIIGDKSITLNASSGKVEIEGVVFDNGALENIKSIGLSGGLAFEGDFSSTSNIFKVNNNQLVILKNENRIGIGTVSPNAAASLDVKGVVKATRFIGDGSGLFNMSPIWTQDQYLNLKYNKGAIAIGNQDPKGWLHIRGGSSSFPSLIISTSSMLASPVPGAVEYYNGNFYLTTSSGRDVVVMGSRSQEVSNKVLKNGMLMGTIELNAQLVTTNVRIQPDGFIQLVTANVNGVILTKTQLSSPGEFTLNPSGNLKIKDRINIGFSATKNSIALSKDTVVNVTGSISIDGVSIDNRSIQNVNDLSLDGTVTMNNGIAFTDHTTLSAANNKNISILATGNGQINIDGYKMTLKTPANDYSFVVDGAYGQVGIATNNMPLNRDIKLLVSGDIKARKFFGDGSGLFGMDSLWKEPNTSIAYLSNKRVGVGVNDPRANFEIAGGSVQYPSLIVATASNLAVTPPPGAIEYYNGLFYLTTNQARYKAILDTATQNIENKTMINSHYEGTNTIKGVFNTSGSLTFGDGGDPIIINAASNAITIDSQYFDIKQDGKAGFPSITVNQTLGVQRNKIDATSGDLALDASQLLTLQSFMSLKKTRSITFTGGDAVISANSGQIILEGITVNNKSMTGINQLGVSGSLVVDGANAYVKNLVMNGNLSGLNDMTVQGSATFENGASVSGNIVGPNGLTLTTPSDKTIRIQPGTEMVVSTNLFQIFPKSGTLPMFYVNASAGKIGVGTKNVETNQGLVVAGDLKVSGTIIGNGSGLVGVDSIWNQNADKSIYYNQGTLGVNESSPQAFIHVAGSSSATPSIIIGSSSQLSSTPKSGAIEYYNGGFYFTNSSGSRGELLLSNSAQSLENKTLSGSITIATTANVSGGLTSPGNKWQINNGGEGVFYSLDVGTDIIISSNYIKRGNAKIEFGSTGVAIDGLLNVDEETRTLAVLGDGITLNAYQGSVKIEDVTFDGSSISGISSLTAGNSVMNGIATFNQQPDFVQGIQVSGNISGKLGVTVQSPTNKSIGLMTQGTGAINATTNIFRVQQPGYPFGTALYVDASQYSGTYPIKLGIITSNISSLGSKSGVVVDGDVRVTGKLYGDASQLSGLSSVWTELSNKKLYYDKGAVGFHKTVPVGYIHIGAGTVATPQFIIDPGPKLTNVTNGALEYSTDDKLYFSTNGNRYEVVLTGLTQTLTAKTLASPTFTGSATVNGTISAASGAWSISQGGNVTANSLVIPSKLRIDDTQIRGLNSDYKLLVPGSGKIVIEDVIAFASSNVSFTGDGSIAASGKLNIEGVTFDNKILTGVRSLTIDETMVLNGQLQATTLDVKVNNSALYVSSTGDMKVTVNTVRLFSQSSSTVPMLYIDATNKKMGIATESVGAQGLAVDGTVKATYLIGDGSGLVNVPSAFSKVANGISYLNGGVAIGTANPMAVLHIVSRNGVLFEYSGTGGNIPKTGAGQYFMWYPKKSAIRGGKWTDATKATDALVGDTSVVFGENNVASGSWAGVLSGLRNEAVGNASAVLSGQGHSVKSTYSAILSGLDNSIQTAANYSVIAGGVSNNMMSSATYGFIGSGKNHSISAQYGTIGGGLNNEVANQYSGVFSGKDNQISGQFTVIGGGEDILVSGNYNSILGGELNKITNDSSSYNAMIGGYSNSIMNAGYAVIGGGRSHTIKANYGSILGGNSNTINTNGDYSIILGGWGSETNGSYAMASGRRAKAIHNGARVFADASDSDFQSTSSNQFLIRASGGVGIGTNAPDKGSLSITNTSGTLLKLTGSTSNIEVNSAGFMRVGGTSYPSRLSVVGSENINVDSSKIRGFGMLEGMTLINESTNSAVSTSIGTRYKVNDSYAGIYVVRSTQYNTQIEMWNQGRSGQNLYRQFVLKPNGGAVIGCSTCVDNTFDQDGLTLGGQSASDTKGLLTMYNLSSDPTVPADYGSLYVKKNALGQPTLYFKGTSTPVDLSGKATTAWVAVQGANTKYNPTTGTVSDGHVLIGRDTLLKWPDNVLSLGLGDAGFVAFGVSPRKSGSAAPSKDIHIVRNSYQDNSGNWQYLSNDTTSRYSLAGDKHQFYTKSAGTGAFSWSTPVVEISNGMTVNGGVTISAQVSANSLIISGSVTANRFVGNGSALTSIGTSAISDGAITNTKILDSGLKALADLSTANSSFIVGDGSTWVVETATTARASLGLTIGTHIQGFDAGLNSIAGLTTTSNQMIYTTASDNYAVAPLTAAARGLLDDADTAAMLNTLGIGPSTSPTFAGITLSGKVTANIITVNQLLVHDTVTANRVTANEISVSKTLTVNYLAAKNIVSNDIVTLNYINSSTLIIPNAVTINANYITIKNTTVEGYLTANYLAAVYSMSANTMNTASLNVSGRVTANYVTANNMSIAGTITANIVTANQMNLSNIFANDADIDGTVTANYVTANSLNVAGVITANKFVGDGSSLTGLGLADNSVQNIKLKDAGLKALAELSTGDGKIIVGNGTTWVAESGATARTSLGLGLTDNVQFKDVSSDGKVRVINSTNTSVVSVKNAGSYDARVAVEILDDDSVKDGEFYLGVNESGVTKQVYRLRLDNSDHNMFKFLSFKDGASSELNPLSIDALGNVMLGHGRGVTINSLGVDMSVPVTVNGDVTLYNSSGPTELKLKSSGSGSSQPNFAVMKVEIEDDNSIWDPEIELSIDEAQKYVLHIDNNDDNAFKIKSIKIDSSGNGSFSYPFEIDPTGNIIMGNGGVVTINATGVSVNGTVTANAIDITGGADFAELFSISDVLEPGSVVVIDPENPGKLMVSNQAYDRKVAGVISGANGIKPGLLMKQSNSIADGDQPVALSGRVWVKCTTNNGTIEPGDLITSSDKKGMAMKVTDYNRSRGAVLGKAMSKLEGEDGYVLILVNLQ